jgi:hypothetical protein
MYSVQSQPVFQKNTLTPSAKLKNKPSISAKACCRLHIGLLLGLLFNPEDGSDLFLWNAGSLLTDHNALCPRKRTSSLFMLGTYTGMESCIGLQQYQKRDPSTVPT